MLRPALLRSPPPFCICSSPVIDLVGWTAERPNATGLGPSPRFGCSLVAYDRKLWVVGGGNGSDLARSGFDLDDSFTLDLTSLEWNRLETTNRPQEVRYGNYLIAVWGGNGNAGGVAGIV